MLVGLRKLFAVLVLAAPACHAPGSTSIETEEARSAERASLGSMCNVSEIDGVWIGSRPTASDLGLARRRGIGIAIDLSPPEDEAGFDLPAACATRSITYLRLEVKKSGALPDETVDRVLAEIRRQDRGPVLLFCTDGSRAAMMFAIWRALDGRIGVEAAIVEARRSGMKPGPQESFVRLQVERRAQRVDAASGRADAAPGRAAGRA